MNQILGYETCATLKVNILRRHNHGTIGIIVQLYTPHED